MHAALQTYQKMLIKSETSGEYFLETTSRAKGEKGQHQLIVT
jgi:hypothetical protein